MNLNPEGTNNTAPQRDPGDATSDGALNFDAMKSANESAKRTELDAGRGATPLPGVDPNGNSNQQLHQDQDISKNSALPPITPDVDDRIQVGAGHQKGQTMERKKLADILKNGTNGIDLRSLFEKAAPAEDFSKTMPRGEYVARLVDGQLFTSKENQTPGFKVTFEIIEGNQSGRKLWHDIWLTSPAMAMAKRDLSKIGVSDLAQLEHAPPAGIICRIRVVIRRNDGGEEFNSIKSFDVERIEPLTADSFAPAT